MNEIGDLMAKTQRYLKSARLLLDDGDCESSVSRSYYPMFYCAQAALLTKDLTSSSHRGLISTFGEHFVKTGVFPRELGRELNRAFAKRQLGDYESTPVVSNEDAEEVLTSALTFCQTIQRWLDTAST